MFNTDQLYTNDEEQRAKHDQQEQPDANTTEDTTATLLPVIEETNDDDDYTLVGTGGKVRWDFTLTSKTTDDEIAQTTTSKLLLAVEAAKEKLHIETQKDGVSIGPRERARRARDAMQNARNDPSKEDRWPARVPISLETSRLS